MLSITAFFIWPLIAAWKLFKLFFRFCWPGFIVMVIFEMQGKKLSLGEFQAMMIFSIPVAMIANHMMFGKRSS